MPAAIVRDDSFGFGWPPRLWLVHMDGRHTAQDRLYDAPRRLHAVLALEEFRVAPDRVAQQSLIRRHLVSRVVPRDQRDLLSFHLFAWLLCLRVQPDDHLRTEAELHT